MFERYTEKARRVIFFARYEASQFGSPYIDTEHLLLGIMREDKALTTNFILKTTSAAAIHHKIETAVTKREKVSTSVDLPLSNECKRVLAYAAEEAARLSHKHIGTEHLFLGLMREEKSFAARILSDIGVELKTVREELAKGPVSTERKQDAPVLSAIRSDLTALAAANKLHVFLGREKEMQHLIQTLGRSTRNSAVLIGEPGSGRRAMVEGLAQNIAEGNVPSFAERKSVLDFDIVGDRVPIPGQTIEALTAHPTILFVEDLMPSLASIPAMKLPASIEILKTLLWNAKIQCVCSATADKYRQAREQHAWVDRYFSTIEMSAMSEAETHSVLLSAKGRLETFHGLTFQESVVSNAVRYSTVLMKGHSLPGVALDLLDAAAAHALTRQHAAEPQELREIQKKISFIVQRMKMAVDNHEFEKGRFYSDEERKEREHLRVLREKYKIKEAHVAEAQVTSEDIEEVLSQWTGSTVSEIRKRLSSIGETPSES
jgi:ATP-dependent Clp protease ATP-binding subunit ClpC